MVPAPTPHAQPSPHVLTDTQAVLFDLDGVLTPTELLHMKAWAMALGKYFESQSLQDYEQQDYYDYLDGKPRTGGLVSILASRGIDVDEDSDLVEQLSEEKNNDFLKLLDQGIDPYPGSLAFLDAVSATPGIKTAVVSSSKNAVPVLRSAGLLDRFDTIVDGLVAVDKGITGKPAPDMYEYAAEQLGVPTQASVVVEDAISGVQAGAAGDFKDVVGVDRGTGHDALKSAGATIIVNDLSDLLDEQSH